MKKFIRRVQNLSQKATELKAAMQQLPPKVAEVREAVAMTTGQLKQLRSDVQSSVADLKSDDEQSLSESLREINDASDVFRRAGYEIGGVDIELSPSQKLIVHLNRVRDVPLSGIRSLRSSNEHRKVVRALLNSLVQAEEMADRVDLTDLAYYKLIVHVGPVPTVRLCWRGEDAFDEVAFTPAAPASAAPAPVAAQPVAATSSFETYGKSSFFERRTPMESSAATASVSPQPPAQVVPEEHPSALRESETIAARDWGTDSLERFKKMPHASKYRR